MRYKEQNSGLLKKFHPHLAPLLEPNIDAAIETQQAKNGLPVFKYEGVAMHGAYKPEEEGARLLAQMDQGVKNVIVFGLGYGHHLRDAVGAGLNVTVVEPSAAIFKSAMENADMAFALEKCRIFVGKRVRRVLDDYDCRGARIMAHRPYLRFFQAEYDKLEVSFITRKLVAERKPRILLAGPIYGGTETTFRYVKEALTALGADVAAFDATAFKQSYFLMDEVTPNETHRHQLKALYSNVLGEAMVAMADDRKPDLILVMAQAPLDVGALARLRQLKIPIAFWFVEDFRTLKYWDRVAPYYDYFFTIQRGEFHERLGKAGARCVAYLPQASAPLHHKPLPLSPEDTKRYGSDISFMGAGYNNRRVFFSGLLDYDFKIWGTEWELSSAVGQRVANRNRRLSPEEYIKIFSASKINLNLHSSIMNAGIDPVGDFVNPRVFELAACGAFQLADMRSELPALMQPGKEIETYASLEELRGKIDRYLKHPEEREAIARAGRERTLEDHTFERRMEELLAVIFSREGETFAIRQKEESHGRNVVKNMVAEAEAKGNAELAAFLRGFDPEGELSLKAVADHISKGKGALGRAESLLLMVNELLVQK
ncbi:MAG: glycosyltransferase [Nitrospinae bacterium]|nr:glycosyltransferase [Nitrospinota bacterium]